MMIELAESSQHQLVLVVLFQVLTNLCVTMFIICDNYFTSIRCCDACFAIEFSRQIALPVGIKYKIERSDIGNHSRWMSRIKISLKKNLLLTNISCPCEYIEYQKSAHREPIVAFRVDLT